MTLASNLPDPVVADIAIHGGRLALGLTLLIGSTIAVAVIRPHLDHPDNPRSAPATAMLLLLLNLVQLFAVGITAFALFAGSG